MTKGSIAWLMVAVLLGAGLGVGGAVLFQQLTPHTAELPARAEKKPLYYRHPMNPKVTSPTPAKDEMGMDFIPVYPEDLNPQAAPGKTDRILYYRHPMGAADTSPVPKKDEMGMDYLPVYEGEAANSRQIAITPEKVQKLGVRTEAVAIRALVRNVRVLGGIQIDERRVHAVAPKFEGWVQRLHVNVTGQAVRRGQPLLDIYSPDLLTAEQEYLIARDGLAALREGSVQARATAELLVKNSLQRLRYWDIPQEALDRLESQGAPLETLPLAAPVSGVVLEKPAVEGMRFMPGEVLFRLADLGEVWLLADVFEQDLDWIRLGQAVQVHINAYPDKEFAGKIGFIYPTLAPETRTVKVRVELSNPQGLLRPGLYGSVTLAAGGQPERPLAVPDSAVLDSGVRKLVLVEKGEGRFEPREVKLGRYADDYFEVLAGLSAGEKVVTRANFLIDAESNLKAALDSLAAPGEPESPQPAAHQHGGH
ncbi:membrane fusion protein, Cu(I)/Ag(I) efflux system [Methylomagnum ishizawai]|uniref:Membrane fusion protein, Cu(I)/Ag(I) efflux system n=1 Tax=Methylomagnum ishizawai TaxID=1760988 RepID=A0A1Y6D4W7_9GAMM|nr:efflux RND transporter periplasmic adaptor subunit [Methylomagnum ishizawai]SMF95005.1 membrane fusion protein, Cu(I)/Ag(I) efflux system [Methylomagnum ishizawai]